MTCPNGTPREPQLADVRRLMFDKKFTIGHPERKKPREKRQTKTQIKQEAEVLLQETGAKTLPSIPGK